MKRSRIVTCMNVGGETESNESPPPPAFLASEAAAISVGLDTEMSHQLPSVNTVINSDTMKNRKELITSGEKKHARTAAPEYLFGEDSERLEDDSSLDTSERVIVEEPSGVVLRRDDLIRSMSQRLASSQPQHDTPGLPFTYSKTGEGAAVPRNLFYLPRALEAAQRWLFTAGGESEDVSSFLTGFSECIGDLGVPLDRLHVGGMVLQPSLSSYVWKWERGIPFDARQVPLEEFEAGKSVFGGDAPFNMLVNNHASRVRLRVSDPSFPHDFGWMRRLGYTDYFALPIKHREQFKGAVAWCTKKEGGFDEDHVKFFESCMSSFSTILRTTMSDLVMSQLVGKLQEQVDDRTKELAKANQDLARANRHVLNQSQTQLRHFAMMSHEIRTPLNGIIGLCSVLQETPLNEEQRDILQTISSSGDLLQRVVDDVLDYSKLAAGRVEIKMQSVDFIGVLEPVIKSMSTKARERNVELRTSIDSTLPRRLYCDGRRLQQILYNLLGNAIKFSNAGGYVDFKVTTVASAIGKRVQITVKDYGKGIAKQHLGLLFKPFLQAHGERSHLYGGTGLGLAITSKLVQALGGAINVDSELARWTEFNVNLPCQSCPDGSPSTGCDQKLLCKRVKPLFLVRQKSDESIAVSTSTTMSEESTLKRGSPADGLEGVESGPIKKQKQDKDEKQQSSLAPQTAPQLVHAAAGGKAASEQSVIQTSPATVPSVPKSRELKSVRILVAEDNKVNQKLMMRVLSRIGSKEVDLVDNGSKAVDKAKEKDYDLILMDMQMPIMDGLQATRLIKQHKNACGRSPVVVFVSAHAVKEIKDQAEDAGAEGFIAKPYNLGQIRDVITSVAERLTKDNDA